MSVNGQSQVWQQVRDASLGWVPLWTDARPTTADLWRAYTGDQLDVTRFSPNAQAAVRRLARTLIGTEQGFNVIGPAVDRRVNDLGFMGLERGADEAEHNASNACWERWEAAGGRALFGSIARTACIVGTAFAMVDVDEDGSPTVSVRHRFDGETGVKVISRDDDGEITAAELHFVREELVDATAPGVVVRLADYFRAKLGQTVERPNFTTQSVYWRYTYVRNPDGTATLLRNVRRTKGVERPADGSPEEGEPETLIEWGFPIVPFVHPHGGEVVRLAAIQDSINQAFLDLLAAAETDAFRILTTVDLTAVGSVQTDVAGRTARVLEMNPGGILQLQTIPSAASAGKIDQIAASDLGQLLKVSQALCEHAAWVSSQPMFTVPGDGRTYPASGRAMRLAYADADEAAEELRDMWGTRVAQINDLLLGVMGLGGPQVLPDWQGRNYGDATEDAQEATALTSVNADPETIAERLNFTHEQKERFLAHLAGEPDRLAAKQAAIMSALDAPLPAGPPDLNGGGQ